MTGSLRFSVSLVILAVALALAVICLSGPALWLGIGLVILIYLLVLAAGVSVISLKFFVPALCRGRTGSGEAALTFDDGPDPRVTPRILDVLDRRGVKVAFFFIGEKTTAHPDLARKTAGQGHIIGNHTFYHAWWTNFLWGRRLDRALITAQEAVYEAIGRRPAFFRPPVGLTNPHLWSSLKRTGLVCVGWDVRSFDRNRPSGMVIDKILKKIRSGSIVILHDSGVDPELTADMLDELIVKIQAKGLRLVRLDKLLGLEPYLPGDDFPGDSEVRSWGR